MAITIILNAAPEATDLGVSFFIENGVKMCAVRVATGNADPGISHRHVTFPAADVTMPVPQSALGTNPQRLTYMLSAVKAYRDHGIALLGL
jgi:hypothetical protein